MEKNQNGKSNQQSDGVSKQKPTMGGIGKETNPNNPTASKDKQKDSKQVSTRDQGRVQGKKGRENETSDEENY